MPRAVTGLYQESPYGVDRQDQSILSVQQNRSEHRQLLESSLLLFPLSKPSCALNFRNRSIGAAVASVSVSDSSISISPLATRSGISSQAALSSHLASSVSPSSTLVCSLKLLSVPSSSNSTLHNHKKRLHSPGKALSLTSGWGSSPLSSRCLLSC